jgi:hypothetical protein
MYATITLDVNFWHALIAIDEEICRQVQGVGCPWCGGPLDRSDYERKPRGIGLALQEAFAWRCSTCCRDCRKRVTPPSVRFLGRKVYAGAIVILATLGVLACGAARRTMERWGTWWTKLLPATAFWQAACGRLMPAVDAGRLPGSLLERFEQRAGATGTSALTDMLRLLQPVTARIGEHFDGSSWTPDFAQKMRFDRDRRDLLRIRRNPARLN